MRAIAYYRKSTDGFDSDGNVRQEGSHDRQRTAVLEFAKRNGYCIVEEIAGKSGDIILNSGAEGEALKPSLHQVRSDDGYERRSLGLIVLKSIPIFWTTYDSSGRFAPPLIAS